LSLDVFGIDYNELHDLDCNVATCDTNAIDWDKQADEILDKSDIEKNDSDDSFKKVSYIRLFVVCCNS
jgi:hypothetical protein